MDLNTGDRVFCTRSNGLRPPATVVGTAEDGLLHLEYYTDGLRVVNRQCKMESISFAIPSPDSPPDCPPSPPPNTQSSSPPKARGPSPCHKNREDPPQGPLQSSLGCLIPRVFPRGVPRGSSGGTKSKSSAQCEDSPLESKVMGSTPSSSNFRGCHDPLFFVAPTFRLFPFLSLFV